MNLAQQLLEISRTKNEELEKAFREKITGHLEEKILNHCLEVAMKTSRTYISLGRSLPPETLLKEGFHVEVNNSIFNFSWA